MIFFCLQINFLSEELHEMDKHFLKTLSERDREVLEECAHIANEQTNEQVSKLWSIYIQRENQLKKRRREERRAKHDQDKVFTLLFCFNHFFFQLNSKPSNSPISTFSTESKTIESPMCP